MKRRFDLQVKVYRLPIRSGCAIGSRGCVIVIPRTIESHSSPRPFGQHRPPEQTEQQTTNSVRVVTLKVNTAASLITGIGRNSMNAGGFISTRAAVHGRGKGNSLGDSWDFK